MRVAFVRPDSLNEAAYQGADSLTVGHEYSVQEIYSRFGGPTFFRIAFAENETPALFDVRLFSVASPAVPSSWAIRLLSNGSMIVGPPAWQVDGFWEAFLDRRRWAVEAYLDGRSGPNQPL